MRLGIVKEVRAGETRVAGTPDSIKKLIKRGLQIQVERSAGVSAGFPDELYAAEGAQIVDRSTVLASDVVLMFHKPGSDDVGRMKKGALLASFLEPYIADGTLEKLASQGVSALCMEIIPRTSRAQSMDALSSQANIAGYRAVLEATQHFGRFFPLMMTSAGSSKAAKVIVLGAGVAGLQAIATAKRLGSQVEAYDIRPEVKEQIQSLGAKSIEFDLGEEGSGQGGYARELSEAAKARQQQLLTERLKKADVIISTANIPGRKAPTLVTEEAVKGMRYGSVIVDMAAANGGNCPLTEAGKIVRKHGVVLVGVTNYPALMPTDSSSFYANNLNNLLALVVDATGTPGEGAPKLKYDMNDDIVAAALVVHEGVVRLKRG